MGYYAIGIGGTGAKYIESLIHLAAAGMIPDDNDLYILFVDPDTANGCLERSVVTLNRYQNFNKNDQLKQKSVLRTKILSADPIFWTPFKDQARPRLSDFFDYYGLSGSGDKNRVAAHLFDVLYSNTERSATLDKGFRGHPSIGASVMAQTVALEDDEPWATFGALIAKDTDPKVFLAGSIFGGTGASGFPTIAQLLKNQFKGHRDKNVQIGGALVLPYFTFNADADEELKAKAEHFLMNTQASLKFYHLWNKTGIYDAIYLFGDESRVEVENALGGPKQRNVPHFIELYAALAAIDFFLKGAGSDDGAQYFMTAREKNNQLEWTDLPNSQIQSKIRQLVRFAFAYLSIYQPMLEDIRQNGKSYRAPWYVDFFKRNRISLNDDKTQLALKNVQDYCQDFLLWLANIQNSVGDQQVGLVKYDAYTQRSDGDHLELKPVDHFDLQRFGNLVSSGISESVNPVNRLSENLCLAKGKGDGTGLIGRFLNTLYENCK